MSPRQDVDDEEAGAAPQEEEKEGIETVLVAVSKHSSSLSALKWTLSHKIAKANCSLKLLHILCSKPTPGTPPSFQIPNDDRGKLCGLFKPFFT